MTPAKPAHIERLPTVMRRSGLSRSSVYAGIAAGTFPKPIKLSARAVGFLSTEIDAWIASRAAQRQPS